MPSLDKTIANHVKVFTDGLEQLAEGAETHEVVRRMDAATEAAFQAALVAGEAARQQGPSRRIRRKVTFSGIFGDRVRDLRMKAGWSQTRLGEAMNRIGWGWGRMAVTELEGGKRRVSLEEALGLAALFGVPALELLIPIEGAHDLELPADRSIGAETVTQLMLGEGGRVGIGGVDWAPAQRAAGMYGETEDWRPAVDLWEYLRRTYRDESTDG